MQDAAGGIVLNLLAVADPANQRTDGVHLARQVQLHLLQAGVAEPFVEAVKAPVLAHLAWTKYRLIAGSSMVSGLFRWSTTPSLAFKGRSSSYSGYHA